MSDSEFDAAVEPETDAVATDAVKKAKKRRRIITWSIIGVVLLVALGASMYFTEKSAFCNTCHEMTPYYSAWLVGGHSGGKAECVDCHVNSGILAHIAHKPIALYEVYSHFFLNPKFPNYGVEIPNTRCTGCHPTVTTKPGVTKFVHAQHEKRATCAQCHAQAGHTVTFESLASAGVLKAGVVATPGIAPAGASPSSAQGHIKVVCQECHDQAKMKCSQCHQAPHEASGECSDCHATGSKFVFVHPAGSTCTDCHEPPAKHYDAKCTLCHSPDIPFKDTKVDHAKVSKSCQQCHTPPKNHYAATCATCHKPSVPFKDTKFTHPAANSNSASSHKPPAGHFSGSCSACHKPSVAFSKATFSHPSAGEHNWRRIACVKCHPNGYSNAYCTCHHGNPPRD